MCTQQFTYVSTVSEKSIFCFSSSTYLKSESDESKASLYSNDFISSLLLTSVNAPNIKSLFNFSIFLFVVAVFHFYEWCFVASIYKQFLNWVVYLFNLWMEDKKANQDFKTSRL